MCNSFRLPSIRRLAAKRVRQSIREALAGEHSYASGRMGQLWERSLALASSMRSFDRLERAGLVRVRQEADVDATIESMCGDCFDPKANPDIRPSKLERELGEFIARIERDGVIGLVAEYRVSETDEWEIADSLWGIEGGMSDAHYRESFDDVYRSAVDSLRNALRERCPMCG